MPVDFYGPLFAFVFELKQEVLALDLFLLLIRNPRPPNLRQYLRQIIMNRLALIDLKLEVFTPFLELCGPYASLQFGDRNSKA